MLLRLSFPSLDTPVSGGPGPQSAAPSVAADYYAAFAAALGAWPPLHLWKRALHRRGLHSWDD
jgi:hypothetical protein